MSDMIKLIVSTPIPTIFVVVGIILLFLAIGGQITTKIITANVKPKHAGILGSIFLILGLVLYTMPILVPTPTVPVQKAVATPAPVNKPTVKDLKSNNTQAYTSNYYRDKADLDQARKIGTVDAYDSFIKTHPRSDWKDTAIYDRDKTAHNDARKVDTLEAYEKFLKKYPNSVWKDKTIYYRDKAALDEVRKVDTVQAYDNFLQKYPNSVWKDKAIYYRDRAAFNDARKIDTVKAYEDFLKKYPKSAWKDNVIYYRDAAASK